MGKVEAVQTKIYYRVVSDVSLEAVLLIHGSVTSNYWIMFVKQSDVRTECYTVTKSSGECLVE